MSRKQTIRARNTLHNHPLLGRGCVHGKSDKARRRDSKVALRQGRWADPV